MEWFTIDDPNWIRFPNWMRSFGISKENNEIYVAAAIAGDEREVLFCSMRENIPAAKNHDHVYVPANWLSEKYPYIKGVCDVLMNLAALQKPANTQATSQHTLNVPWRSLSLRYPITPENGVAFAVDAAELARAQFGLTLDFTAESLLIADELIDQARDASTPSEGIAEYLFHFGCYLGQVMVKKAGCTWVNSQGTELENHTDFPIVLRLRDGTHAQPISKAFKRFNNGAEDSIMDFYEVFRHGAFIIGKIR